MVVKTGLLWKIEERDKEKERILIIKKEFPVSEGHARDVGKCFWSTVLPTSSQPPFAPTLHHLPPSWAEPGAGIANPDSNGSGPL